MKIQVIKKANVQINTYGSCPFLVDCPPDGGGVRTGTTKK